MSTERTALAIVVAKGPAEHATSIYMMVTDDEARRAID